MQFLWPQMLWLLLGLPLLVAAYLYLIARRKKAALLYSSVALPRAVLGRRQRLRRHIPPFLVLLGLGVALLACARPTATVTLPSDTVTVVLAMDTSRSMAAADVAPTRIAAAQHAARDFIIGLPASVRLGIVSFAATATVVLSPTDSRQDMLDAIERFQLQHGTATGSGLIQALAVLLPDDGIDLEAIIFGGESLAPGSGGRSLAEAAAAEAVRKREQEQPSASPGSYRHGAIILLSDGRRTTGPDPLDAARMAAQRGVRVYTVGFGTPLEEGAPVPGLSSPVQLDEATLRQVAMLTDGEYFQASSAADLTQVYRRLSSRLALERKEVEVSALLAAGAVVLLILACGLSVVWFRR